jgi:hypothetical protein
LSKDNKETFGKVKLMGRSVAQVHREAESSLLAVQLGLAHGLLALQRADQARGERPSPRKVLVEIRKEIRTALANFPANAVSAGTRANQPSELAHLKDGSPCPSAS